MEKLLRNHRHPICVHPELALIVKSIHKVPVYHNVLARLLSLNRYLIKSDLVLDEVRVLVNLDSDIGSILISGILQI
jgi:hypothetical protein